jgi:RNA polymerase sigma-70 factor (ECF subfamily)
VFTPASIGDIYDAHVAFVARMARGLGVPVAAVDDVVQDVFLVVHRKLGEFEGRAQLRTWIARIVLNVVRGHRRDHARVRASEAFEDDAFIDPQGKSPDEVALEREAVRLLGEILDAMPEEQRVVFVLAEIEGLEMAEVAESLSINVNTAYSRLRLARKEYERGAYAPKTRGGGDEGRAPKGVTRTRTFRDDAERIPPRPHARAPPGSGRCGGRSRGRYFGGLGGDGVEHGHGFGCDLRRQGFCARSRCRRRRRSLVHASPSLELSEPGAYLLGAAWSGIVA